MSELEPEIRRVLALIAEENAAKIAAEHAAFERVNRESNIFVIQIMMYLTCAFLCGVKTVEALDYICIRYLNCQVERYSWVIGTLGAIGGALGLRLVLCLIIE